MIGQSSTQGSSPQRDQRNQRASLDQFLSESDQFRQRPELRVMQQESYSTVFGQCMTILMIVICLAMFISSLYSLVNHVTPSISQTQEVLVETSPYPLYRDNFTLVIAIRDVYGNPFSDLHEFLQFQVQNCLLNQTTQADGSILTIPRCSNYSMQQCDMQTSFKSKIQTDYFSQRNLSGVYCINSTEWDENPISIQGTQQARVYQLLQVLTRACSNTSSYSNCQTQENINARLQQSITYVFIIYGTLSQVANYDEPFQNFIATKYTILSIGASKTVYQNLAINEVTTDSGIILDDKNTNSMLSFLDIETDSNPYNGLALCNHMITITGVKNTYSRSYQKLQAILGQVGGLWQICFFIFGIFIHRMVKKMLYLHMAHDLFDINLEAGITLNNKNDLEEQRIHNIISGTTREMKINKKSLCKFLCGIESPQKFEMAHQKIQDSVDLQYILGKLNEIDQLKEIILTKEQNQLFEFMSKPVLEHRQKKSWREIMKDTRNAYLKIKNNWKQTDQNLFHKLSPQLISALNKSNESRQNEQSPMNTVQPIVADLIYDDPVELEANAQRPRVH